MLYWGHGFINKVEVIKNLEDIEAIKKVLKESSLRNYLMFIIGINTGLNITELLSLKFTHLLKDTLSTRECIKVEGKSYLLNNSIEKALYKYIDYRNQEDILGEYIFESRNGKNPIERCQAYRILNDASRKAEVDLKIGTHTMRKTFGYHFYKKFKDIKYLQELFNHSAPSITFSYIDTTEQIEKDYKEFNL